MSEKMMSQPNAVGGRSDGKPEQAPKRFVLLEMKGPDGKTRIVTFDRDQVMAAYGVVDIVRMQREDFPQISSTPGTLYDHFNIKKTDNRPRKEDEPERKYLIAMIAGPGQPEPLLSLDKALIAECLKAESGISYEQLRQNPKYFEHSLESGRDVPALEVTMQKRYGPGSSRNLPSETVLAQGVGWTLFEIKGYAPSVQLPPELTP